jgi:hypothetical protein
LMRRTSWRTSSGSSASSRVSSVLLMICASSSSAAATRCWQGDLLEQLLGDADPEVRRPEQLRTEQNGTSPALAPPQPQRQAHQRGHTDEHERPDALATLVSHQHTEDDAAHTRDREEHAHRVPPVPLVGHISHEADPGQDHGDDNNLEREAQPPGNVVMNPPSSGPTVARSPPPRRRGRRPSSASRRRSSPWMSDCMAGSNSEAPIPPTIAQNTLRSCALASSAGRSTAHQTPEVALPPTGRRR